MAAHHARLRALLIVVGALAATAMPTVAAFAEPPPVPVTESHTTPREEIQPAAHIVGELARKTVHRFTGKPLGLVPEKSVPQVRLKAPQRTGPDQSVPVKVKVPSKVQVTA
ncbi:hypothetical protein AB0J38_19175 [Streptomyces sp. NPDC050095]|uniref:hypothetical protein n=1 Tax=unclassified Streptomyces TaxID=2593676 RepID=UPI003428B883